MDAAESKTFWEEMISERIREIQNPTEQQLKRFKTEPYGWSEYCMEVLASLDQVERNVFSKISTEAQQEYFVKKLLLLEEFVGCIK